MIFNNEMISREDVERLDTRIFNVKYPAADWTINEERDIFLILFSQGGSGGGRDSPTFRMGWKGHIITIFAKIIWEELVPGCCLEVGVHIPRILGDKRVEVLETVRESLFARGHNGTGKHVREVTINNYTLI